MHPPLSTSVWSLPEQAVPFLRELLLEISRRLPCEPGCDCRFEPSDLRDAAGCLAACRGLLDWLDGAPQALNRKVAELDAVLVSVLDAAQEMDAKLHRAVVQTRAWVGEELAFSHAVKGVLEDLSATAFPPPSRGPDLLDKVVRQIEAQEERGQGEALALSGHFDRVQEDLHGLRDRVARMEAQARHVLDQGLRDALTGLWNRRAYAARIVEEVSRAVRYGAPLSLVVWDVDRLQGINDEHGHRAGDVVLCELTGRILGALRRSDFVARYGGEEFLAVLPNTLLAQAANVARKIRAAAETEPIRLPGGPLSVTVSAGVASLEPCDDPATLFARAERALARAKAGGRNRVEVESP